MNDGAPTADFAQAAPLIAAVALPQLMQILQDVGQGHTKLDRHHAQSIHDALQAGSLVLGDGHII